MPLTVYKLDASPPARTVLIVADILGLQIETREVNLFENEHQTAEYLEKNPLHTVPLLEDGDFVLADSHAIVIYLIAKYGTEKTAVLYPIDVKKRATIHERLFFDASILFGRHLAVCKDVAFSGATSIDESKAASVREAYGFLEKYLERSTFVAGDHITIADIACVNTITNANILVPLDGEYPKIKAWLDVLSNQKWYQKYIVPGVSEFKKVVAAQLQKPSQ